MTEIEVETWEEFDEYASRLARERADRKSETDTYISEYLFRGHSDSCWRLDTSLERFSGRLLTLREYYRILCAVRPQVETFTGVTWDTIPPFSDYRTQIGDEGVLLPGTFPAYAYFVYLRHHGFPSPLLDWTRSPYVAAYFAFSDVHSEAAKVSIYAYCEYTTGHKLSSSDKPKITGLGPYVRSHRRHFQQQSEYTICTKRREGEHTYARHDEAFSESTGNQDELWKFNIPSSERRKVLKRLEQYNINAFSLFGSEESLMETLAFREILFRDR